MNRLFTYLVSLTIFIVGIPVISAAQDADRFLGNAGPLEIYASDSLCCSPTHASILEEKLDPGSTAYYRFRNIGDKPVAGIAVTFSNGEWKRLHYAAFVRREAPVRPWTWKGFSWKAGEKLTVEIDFVLFADGSTWGPDIFGKGEILKDFRKGYELALDRVLKEAGGEPNPQIDKLLETTIGFHFAADIPSSGREPMKSRPPVAIGYDGVIAILGRGDEAARSIANKVRSMPIE
jgi:hypothetical protein